ncbi:MAG: hypothetical protein A3E21_03215 [Sulfurimonas sp. RIFCSPHIGHO2_12_FULL_36_9]|uniref:NfeD family protein n=1 Tax=Sulfurimonas sp. RIFCSPLOWO2_12_36_12 TaxID=1802253 RepID=UPI0008CB2E86|nr:nodulation efficiency protein D [Sulfurimonas sp. RIFCSPLOWO2_12_36_12]OHD98009.1 MAG: hypothetical protein A3E21_03215 [Sulfurimonas sp. RIFCSPHIGHO2_12_FULL_36_9]OHD99241.1 MAG: hypothetical protein A3J26_04405 [Sulfurimonas sp. RIFCSPLOWO2_02_FULL_36_28]OHE02863.1 MAG: hypothetical protein A2W82_09940 [Sulfurimonas sp. RIFCSPLOWO2_12_36_12]
MDIQILEPITPMVLIGVGIALIAAESLIFSFFVFWFGIGFILVGILSIFVEFYDGAWQLASVSVIAMILLITLRAKIVDKFLDVEENQITVQDFLNESGFGVIKENKVYYKATYWNIERDEDVIYEDGEEVYVIRTHKGFAKIKRVDK